MTSHKSKHAKKNNKKQKTTKNTTKRPTYLDGTAFDRQYLFFPIVKSHRFPYVTVLNNSKTRATVLKMICSFIFFCWCSCCRLFDVKMLFLLRFAVGGVDGFFCLCSAGGGSWVSASMLKCLPFRRIVNFVRLSFTLGV